MANDFDYKKNVHELFYLHEQVIEYTERLIQLKKELGINAKSIKNPSTLKALAKRKEISDELMNDVICGLIRDDIEYARDCLINLEGTTEIMRTTALQEVMKSMPMMMYFVARNVRISKSEKEIIYNNIGEQLLKECSSAIGKLEMYCHFFNDFIGENDLEVYIQRIMAKRDTRRAEYLLYNKITKKKLSADQKDRLISLAMVVKLRGED